MQDPLIQTRIPAAVLERVQEAAEAQGDTIAGWLRRLVVKETRMTFHAAWLAHENQADPTVHFIPGNYGPPTHFLEPLRDHSALERTFLLFGRDGSPLSFEAWRESQGFKRQAQHVFLIDGSASVWRIVTTVAETASEQIEITLSAGPPVQSFRSYSDATARYKQLGAVLSRGSGRATLQLGSAQVSLNVADADPAEMVLPRLVAMLERGLGLQ